MKNVKTMKNKMENNEKGWGIEDHTTTSNELGDRQTDRCPHLDAFSRMVTF